MILLVIATVVVGVALHGSWLARRRRAHDYDTLLAGAGSLIIMSVVLRF